MHKDDYTGSPCRKTGKQISPDQTDLLLLLENSVHSLVALFPSHATEYRQGPGWTPAISITGQVFINFFTTGMNALLPSA